MSNQVLLRLPDDLAARFAQVVAPRQRGRFLLDLLRRELERESSELKEAAKRLTEIEAGNPSIAVEENEWLAIGLAADGDDEFDAEVFEHQYREAQALHEPGKTRTKIPA
jgi:hypothetical protein